MAVNYKLVSFSFCPFVQRPRIIMLEKQMPHEVEYIDLQSPPVWFHDVSPLEKVPVLMVDDTPLFESMPICEYLNEVSDGSLYSEAPLERARERAWIEFANEVLGLNHQLVTAADETAYKRARAVMLDRLESVEDVLGEGPFFAGDRLGMVDVVYAPILRFFRVIHDATGVDMMADLPGISAWAKTLLAHPSVRDAVPDNFESEYLAFLGRQKSPLARQLKN